GEPARRGAIRLRGGVELVSGRVRGVAIEQALGCRRSAATLACSSYFPKWALVSAGTEWHHAVSSSGSGSGAASAGCMVHAVQIRGHATEPHVEASPQSHHPVWDSTTDSAAFEFPTWQAMLGFAGADDETRPPAPEAEG